MMKSLNPDIIIFLLFLFPILGFGMEPSPDPQIWNAHPFPSPQGKYMAIPHEGYFEIRDGKSDKTNCYWPVPGERDIFLSWSPDGNRIAFSGKKDNQLGVWILDIPHKKTVQIAEGRCYKPTWDKETGQLSCVLDDNLEKGEKFSIDPSVIQKSFSAILPNEPYQGKLQPCDVELLSFPSRTKTFQRGARLNTQIVLKEPPAYALFPNGVRPGVRYFSDRSYVLTDVPEVFEGLPLLQSARCHDPNTQTKYSIVCSVPVPSLVFVAMDERTLAYWIFMGIIPDWIKEYAVTPYRILGNDLAMKKKGFGFRILARRIPAGPIELRSMSFCFFAKDDPSFEITGGSPTAVRDDVIYRSLSQEYHRRGQYHKAMEYAKKAAFLAPNNAWSQSNLGLILFSAGQLEKAMHALKKSILLGPRRSWVYETLVKIYVSQNDYSAIHGLANALECVMRKDAVSYIYLGTLFEKGKKYFRAVQAYKKAIKLSPNCGDGIRYLIEQIQKRIEQKHIKPEWASGSTNQKKSHDTQTIFNEKEIMPIPPRDTAATGNMIDLTDHYNCLLHETFFRGRYYPELFCSYSHNVSELPVGIQTFNGVPFDVRGLVILLSSRDKSMGYVYPEKVEGIAVKQQFKKLHVLFSALYPSDYGKCIGTLVLHYTNRASETLDIIYGRDIYDWMQYPTDPRQFKKAKVAWKGHSERSRNEGTRIRLYTRTWENPQPEKRVESIDIVSRMTESAPFFIALTVE